MTAPECSGERRVNSPGWAGRGLCGTAVPIVPGAVAAALIALIAAGVLLLAAVLFLAKRASRMSRSLSLMEGRLGLPPGGSTDPGVVSAALDRQEAASAGLQRDLERLREALDAAGVGILVVDPDGNGRLRQPGRPALSERTARRGGGRRPAERGRVRGPGRRRRREPGTGALRAAPPGGAPRGDASRRPPEGRGWGRWPTSPTSPRSAGWRRCGGTSWPTWATS